MSTVLESIAEHGLDHEVLDADALAKRFPQFRVEDGDAAVLDRHAGFIRPELTILSAARRAEELGARIHRYTPVREIVPVGNGVEIRTDERSEHFDAAVVTVGPWVNDLLPDLPWEVDIRRLLSAWYVPGTDAWFGEERPAFIRTAPTHCYGLPSPDGVSVKLGLSRALHRPVDDPNRLDRTVEPEELEIFTELIRHHMPDLNPDPIRLSVYMEGYTESSRPLMGPLSGSSNDNVILLAGFSGHGFKLSPAFGDIAADLALDGSTPQPIDFLSTIGRTAA
jgi:sarcosine oxidase